MLTGLSAATRKLLTIGVYQALGDNTFPGIIHLFQNSFQPGPFAKLADFHQCDFNGYSPVSGITGWLGYLVPGSNDWSVQPGAVIDFNSAPMTVPQTAYGWYATDSTGLNLLAWGVFDVPLVFSQGEQGIIFVPTLFIAATTGLSY